MIRDKSRQSATALMPGVGGVGNGRGALPPTEEAKGQLTCTTRTKLSGYLVKTAEKASTGSLSTVESRAALADTVRWGCW